VPPSVIATRQLAADALRRVHHGAFSQAVLASTLDERTLSKQDRNLVTDLLYGTLRHQILVDACLAPRLKRPDKLPHLVYNALRLGTYEVIVRDTPRFAAVNTWVEVVKQHEPRLAGLVNAVLRRVDVPTDVPLSTRYGLPEWLYNSWQTQFGADLAERIALGMNAPEPLWISVYHDQVRESLEAEGCDVHSGPIKNSLALRPSKPLQHLTAFERGWLQPQNPSSRLPVNLLNPPAGARVFDLASGNGIKAAQLAALGAEVVSVDNQASKLDRAKRNLARLGFIAQNVTHDLRTPLSEAPAPYVLLDAPCSGTGTLRGNPELRQRVTPNTITELAGLQQELLSTAATLCTDGGTFVYAVCSLQQPEAEDNARWFLETHPDFTALPFDLPVQSICQNYGHYVIPENGLDGFYIARFARA
jgi:16S rRNA (cytosine967-C5)-methyltransferase